MNECFKDTRWISPLYHIVKGNSPHGVMIDEKFPPKSDEDD